MGMGSWPLNITYWIKVRAHPEGFQGGKTLSSPFRHLAVLHGGRGAPRASCANRTPTVCRTLARQQHRK